MRMIKMIAYLVGLHDLGVTLFASALAVDRIGNVHGEHGFIKGLEFPCFLFGLK